MCEFFLQRSLSVSKLVFYSCAEVQEKNLDMLSFTFLTFTTTKWRKPSSVEMWSSSPTWRSYAGVPKGICIKQLPEQLALIPPRFPQAPCSPKESVGPQWWDLWWALHRACGTLHHAAHLLTSSPLQMQEASAQKPEHVYILLVEFCAFWGGWRFFVTWTLPFPGEAPVLF